MSLLQYGTRLKNQAITGMQQTANQEQTRDAANKQLKTAAKNMKVGAATTGAALGFMVGGPPGAAIGGALGYLTTEIF